MPVSHLARPVVDAAGVFRLDPARHRQGGARRQPLRRRQQRRGADRLRGAGLPVRHPAGGAVRRRQLRAVVPAARAAQHGHRKLELAGARRGLSLAHGAADRGAGGRRLRRPDRADQELLPGGNPQAVRRHRPRQGRQRAAHAVPPRVPQRHAADHRRVSRRRSSASCSPRRCWSRSSSRSTASACWASNRRSSATTR